MGKCCNDFFFKGKDIGKTNSNAGRYLKMFSLRQFAAPSKETVHKQQPTLGSSFLLLGPPLLITKGQIQTYSHLAVWGSQPTLSCDRGRRQAAAEHRNRADGGTTQIRQLSLPSLMRLR